MNYMRIPIGKLEWLRTSRLRKGKQRKNLFNLNENYLCNQVLSMFDYTVSIFNNKNELLVFFGMFFVINLHKNNKL